VRSRPTARRLWFEPLEDRTLPSFGFGWAFNVGGTAPDSGYGITTDASRNVYVTGYIGRSSRVNFDPNHTNPSNPNNTLTNPAGTGGLRFVAKYTSTSTFQWVTGLGMITGRGRIAVDGAGNVYVANGDPSNNNATDVFKLDAASGTIDWKVALSEPSNTGITVGPSGDVYITGTNASAQAFVAKLDPSGNVLWNQPLGGSNTDGLAVAVDSAEHVYVAYASVTTTTTSHGKKSPPPPPTYNIQVASINAASGSTIWSGSLGSYGNLSGGIAVDSAGNVYVAGGGTPFFVAKLLPSSNGALTQSWNEQFSVSGGVYANDWASGVAVDGAGNVYTTGSFEGSVNFDPGPGTFNLQSAGGDDVFVSELNTSGNFVAAADIVRPLNPIDYEYGYAITLDSSGNIYTTGMMRGTANFNPTGTYDLTVDGGINSPDPDVFVSQLTQSSSAGGAAASSPADTGSKLAVLLAASPLSLDYFVESSNPLQAAGGGASQEMVFHPVVLDGSEFATSRQPSHTGNAIPSRPPWPAGERSAADMLDRVFAELGTELYSGGLATGLESSGPIALSLYHRPYS
jgi:hypothetical protein